MHIKSLRLKGFRSFHNETLTFSPGLTTFVGENNTGKSSIALAMTKLFVQMTIGNDQITFDDYPYGHLGQLNIEAIIELNSEEYRESICAKIIPSDLFSANHPIAEGWLLEQGREISVSLNRPSKNNIPYLFWGKLKIFNDQISASQINEQAQGPDLDDPIRNVIGRSNSPREVNSMFGGQYTIRRGLLTDFGSFCLQHFKVIDEFRTRPTKSKRESGAIESMNGFDTANVLLTLKNHADPGQKIRYSDVQNSFHTLFPHYTIDAIESGPGSNIPDVQFYEKGRLEPLILGQVSSGVIETLTLVTNLVGRSGLIVFLEHPELHLHPHILRWLQAFLVKSSVQNQVIVVTHDPFLIEPNVIPGIRRFWWLPKQGTKIHSVPNTLNQVEIEQMGTALRYLGDREVVFARSVLLVEDESLKEFICVIAPTLGYDLNASGVSVIFTGGDRGHRPYHVLLNALGIPHVNLRDKVWGDNTKFPADRYFSLGAEFEEYMDKQGLADIRMKISKEAGNSHRRQASLLGKTIEKSQVPSLFDQVLKEVVNLANGAPVGTKKIDNSN